jgi:hypothetical protein
VAQLSRLNMQETLTLKILNNDDSEPTVTLIISGNGHTGEYTLTHPLFKTFDEAETALNNFIKNYSC